MDCAEAKSELLLDLQGSRLGLEDRRGTEQDERYDCLDPFL